MKAYPTVDLTSDSYLNPVGANYPDGSGKHQRSVGAIRSISIHHDAVARPHNYDSVARYKQEAKEHYNRLGPGLQYHYKIDNVGTIFKVRPLTTWLYSVGTSENTSTIAICLDGYFHPNVNQRPTREQYEALGQLLIELCEHHPEFPASYPDVRPHRDYKATACCGDHLAPWVTAVQSKADVLRIPDGIVYDWPSLQPPPTTPSVPAPPADTRDEWEKNLEVVNPAVYIAQVKTHLDDLVTGARIKDYEPGQPFDIVRITKVKGQDYYITAYSFSKKIAAGIPAKDLVVKGSEPIPPSDPDPNQPPPVVENPPTPDPGDQQDTPDTPTDSDIIKENNSLLKAIKEALDWLVIQLKKLLNIGG